MYFYSQLINQLILDPKNQNFDEDEKDNLMKNNIEKIQHDKEKDSDLDIYFNNQDLNNIIIVQSSPIFVRNFKPDLNNVPNKEWQELLQGQENFLSINHFRNEIIINGIININNNNNIGNGGNRMDEIGIIQSNLGNNQLSEQFRNKLTKNNDINLIIEDENKSNDGTISDSENNLMESKEIRFDIITNDEIIFFDNDNITCKLILKIRW